MLSGKGGGESTVISCISLWQNRQENCTLEHILLEVIIHGNNIVLTCKDILHDRSL